MMSKKWGCSPPHTCRWKWGATANMLQPPQDIEALVDLHYVGCVQIRDLYPQVFKAGDHLNRYSSKVEGRESDAYLQLFHFLPVFGLITVSDESHHCFLLHTSQYDCSDAWLNNHRSALCTLGDSGHITRGKMVLRIMGEGWVVVDSNGLGPFC